MSKKQSTSENVTLMSELDTELSASQFMDSKLRLFSAHSNVRGIPFIGDGFKQAHRKAIYGMIKRGENAEKDTVERIAAASASVTDYHHGVGSLESTIVGLAQDFAGSNNMPLFEGFGQLGNRLSRQAAASRYIKAKLSPNFRQLFRKEDDLIFEYVVSNGHTVEPKFFTPILPLVLVNGAEGMGTGHSTFILSYNPADIKNAILKMLDGKVVKTNSLLPWWRGYNGTVARDEETGQVIMTGVFKRNKTGRNYQIILTELPIGAERDSYDAHLQKLEDRGVVLSYDDFSDKQGFEFIANVPRETYDMSDEEIQKTFKLVKRETENLTVWDGDGILKRYDTVEELLGEWVVWRVGCYEDRRQALIRQATANMLWASIKIRFIKFYLSNVEYFRDTGTKELVARLVQEGFERYDELLSMPMRNLTHDKIKELEKEVDELKHKIDELNIDTAVSMFIRELKELKV